MKKVLFNKADGTIAEIVDVDAELNGVNPKLGMCSMEVPDGASNISECEIVMVNISKLAILEALDELPEERAKFDKLMHFELFRERWLATATLDMHHPLTKKALEQAKFDITKVKSKILGI